MSRDLQHKLHAHLIATAARLDLPLTAGHLERLAVELTPAIATLLAEPQAVGHAVTAVLGDERVVSEYAGCTLSIRPDVSEDAPAALLGLELRRTQSDVLALDVPAADQLVVTVRPRSPQAWASWRDRFEVVDCTPEQPCCTTSTGHYGDVRVELRGEGVPYLLTRPTDEVPAGHPW